MSFVYQSEASFRSIFWPIQKSISKQVFLVLTAATLLAISSQVSIPWVPVPLTFQSATVLAIGMLYGSRLGAFAILTYLSAGLLGLPVFAGGAAGPLVFVGPTAGYLIGFVPGAYISGFLAEKGFSKGILSALVASVVGALPIFLLGALVLSFFVGTKLSFALGVKPFILTEVIKLFVVSLFVPRFWKKN
jgi:biotin transport system substrate-specific component